jgi:5'-3' exonuclease
MVLYGRSFLYIHAGLKRLESGALIKDYEGPEKELEQAVQMVISEVASEDPRFLEKDAPHLSDEFPDGTNIFFLGEHAYGVAAQVSSTTDNALSVVLAVCHNALPRFIFLNDPS